MSDLPEPTHGYISIAWYKDWQTIVNILSLAALVFADADLRELVPENYHFLLAKIVIFINLVLRYATTTRPIAAGDGRTREVKSIPPVRP